MTQVRLALRGELEETYRKERRFLATVTTAATREATGHMRTRLKADTTRALGARMGNTWSRPQIFPRRGVSINAAGVVFSKAPNVIIAHERERTLIRPMRGQWLAIPLPSAPVRGQGRFRNRSLTPQTYRQVFNTTLVFVPLRGDRAMLVDPNREPRGGGRRAGAGGAAGRARRGTPVFLLVKRVSLAKRLRAGRIGEQSLRRLVNQLVFHYNFSQTERAEQLAEVA